MTMRSGAQIIWECLQREGVEVVFGYPGGCNLPMYDALAEFPAIHHVLVRHEQNAGHAADGFARASGKVGVALGTSGPGATNLVTAIATAMLDSVPTVFITGQVGTGLIGSDAFQETDVTGVTLPITKHNYLVMRTEELAPVLREAFHIARSGRPGPVLVDIPKDVQIRQIDFSWPEEPPRRLSERRPWTRGTSDWDKAAQLINEARRPVILAGQGVLLAGAEEQLRAFAEKTGTPVAFTLLGLDAMPSDHPLAMAMMGMHGEAFVNHAIQGADLLLAFGMRFDDRVTGKLATYAPNARKVHIDIDPAELGKNVRADVAIVSDLRVGLERLLPLVQPARHDDWMAQIAAWRGDTSRRDIVNLDSGGRLWAAHVIHELWKSTGGDCVVTTDVGQHQMWVAQYFRPNKPHTFVWSGGLGTMGFGLPSAVGAQFARRGERVWAVCGDGGFQMSIPELATLAQERLPVKIAVINNGYLGMVRQWQEFFYDKNYQSTPLLSPDFVKLAEAYGILGLRVERPSELSETIRRAHETPGPVLVEFRVVKEDLVYPMVPAGVDLDQMIRRPTPQFEENT